eukprot:1220930-Prymnesium_polylepis.1
MLAGNEVAGDVQLMLSELGAQLKSSDLSGSQLSKGIAASSTSVFAAAAGGVGGLVSGGATIAALPMAAGSAMSSLIGGSLGKSEKTSGEDEI